LALNVYVGIVNGTATELEVDYIDMFPGYDYPIDSSEYELRLP
jgi:hypothetical protein